MHVFIVLKRQQTMMRKLESNGDRSHKELQVLSIKVCSIEFYRFVIGHAGDAEGLQSPTM